MVLAAVLLIAGSSNYFRTGHFEVLSYATDVNVSDLFTETNTRRVEAGLPAYVMSSKLSSAAQNKAIHMVANDYWSHIAPDGTTPWDFMDQASYIYLKAGENLAYGFLTSAGTVEGWMNSPGHRANILDEDFTQVGFGFLDGENFQGDENTVVVAMYGLPYESTSSSSQVVTSSTSTFETSQPTSTVPTTEDTTKTAEPVEDEKLVTESENQPLQVSADEAHSIIEVSEGRVAAEEVNARVITNFEALLSGQAPLSMYLTLGLLVLVGMVFALRHARAIHQFIVHGEHQLEGHPLLEASLIYALIWLVLSASYGVII